MRKSISSTALAITVYCLVPLLTAAAVILPSRDISFSRRSNLTTPSALKLTTSDPLNLTTSSGLNLTTSNALNVVNTNPKLGGWCTFHLSYYTSQQLGFSRYFVFHHLTPWAVRTCLRTALRLFRSSDTALDVRSHCSCISVSSFGSTIPTAPELPLANRLNS